MVAERERSVTDLARPFEISLAAVSKHLKTLEAALERFLGERKRGTRRKT